MAVVYNPSDKDQDQQNQTQNGSQPTNNTSNTTMNAGNSAPITASSSSSSQSPSGPTGTSSGRFTNITNYLNANKNFNQGDGLGGKIVNNVQQQNQNLNTGVQNATQTFNQQANDNRRQYDQGFVNNTINNATTAVTNPNDVNKFGQMRDASYQGPTALQDAPKLQVQAQNIADTTSQLGNEQGRFNSLRQMFNRPTYSSGQQKLDNLLVQNDPNQIKQMNNARVLGNQAQNTVNQANTQAQAQGQLYTQEANNTKQQTQDALNKAFTDQDSALQAKVDAANTAQTNLRNDLTSGTVTQAEADRLGLTNGMSTFGLNLSDYLNNIDANKQTVANADDYSRYQALSKLANIDPTVLTNPQLAGTYDSQLANQFNKDNFNSARSSTEQNYLSDLANAKFYDAASGTYSNNPFNKEYFDQQYGPNSAENANFTQLAAQLRAQGPSMVNVGDQQIDANAIGSSALDFYGNIQNKYNALKKIQIANSGAGS